MRFQTVFAVVRAWILGLGFVLQILDSIPYLDPPSTFYGARIHTSRTYMDGKHSTLYRRASALDPAPSTPLLLGGSWDLVRRLIMRMIGVNGFQGLYSLIIRNGFQWL